MASGLYDLGRQSILQGSIAWNADTVKVILVDAADYTVNLATHQFLSDVPAGARVSTASLAGKSSTNGIADATDTTFTAVTGDQSEGLVIYKDSGVEGTSSLIAYIDISAQAVTPNGNDIQCAWDNGANKIFKL